MALVYKLSFEGQHHLVEVRFRGETEFDLDAEVADAFPFWDPSEAYLASPFPGFLFLAGPNGYRLVPIYFYAGGFVKEL